MPSDELSHQPDASTFDDVSRPGGTRLNFEPTKTEDISVPTGARANKDLGTLLLVEPNLMVALDLEGTLLSMGFVEIRTFDNAQTARESIDYHNSQIALLNIDPDDPESQDLMERLRRSDIPFVVITSVTTSAQERAEGERFPSIVAPVSRDDLNILIDILDVRSSR